MEKLFNQPNYRDRRGLGYRSGVNTLRNYRDGRGIGIQKGCQHFSQFSELEMQNSTKWMVNCLRQPEKKRTENQRNKHFTSN